MLHNNRHWVVGDVATPEDLAQKLTEHTWCGCNGFRVEGTEYLFLNDATSGDGAQEYGAIKRLHGTEGARWLQVESLTFSWCTYESALALIRKVLAGEYDQADYAYPVILHLDTPEQHGRCAHCA
jgi:hypothetical protein